MPATTQKSYYERYWLEEAAGHSGNVQGYAANFRAWMARQLHGLPNQARVLEVGCGDGAFTRDLARFSRQVTALDLSAAQIQQNARAYPDIQFQQHDLADPLPFPPDHFAVIWCSEVLEHLFDPAFAVREMHRVLAPGGRLLVTVPYHGLGKNLLIALLKWDAHFAPNNPHLRFFTKNTLRAVVAGAGFARIVLQTCGMGKPVRDLFIPTNILLTAEKGWRPKT